MQTTKIKPLDRKEFARRVCDLDQTRGEWRFQGERPVVIDFYAAWCGPCKVLAPILEELADEYEYRDRVDFYKIDIDREQLLAEHFGIRSVPTLLFIPMDGPPQMMVGARHKVDLRRAIDIVL